jgi:hypothetical protein
VVRNNKAMVRESRSVGTSLSGSKRLWSCKDEYFSERKNKNSLALSLNLTAFLRQTLPANQNAEVLLPNFCIIRNLEQSHASSFPWYFVRSSHTRKKC